MVSVPDAIGRQNRKPHVFGQFTAGFEPCFFMTIKVALQFHVDIGAPKDVGELDEALSRYRHAPVPKCPGQWAAFVSGQADEARGVFG